MPRSRLVPGLAGRLVPQAVVVEPFRFRHCSLALARRGWAEQVAVGKGSHFHRPSDRRIFLFNI